LRRDPFIKKFPPAPKEGEIKNVPRKKRKTEDLESKKGRNPREISPRRGRSDG